MSVVHPSLPPPFGYGMTLATVLWSSSERVLFFLSKVCILLLEGKASNKKVFIIESKLSLNPTHSYHLFMLADIYFYGFQ